MSQSISDTRDERVPANSLRNVWGEFPPVEAVPPLRKGQEAESTPIKERPEETT